MSRSTARDSAAQEPRSGWSDLLARSWVTPLLAGAVVVLTVILMVVSFPPFDTPEAAYLWAAPFLVWVLLRRPSWRLTWVVAGSSQAVGWILILRWLRHFPEHAGVAFPTIIGWSAMILLGIIVGLFGTAWLVAARSVLPRCRGSSLAFRLVVMLGLAAFWVVLEWIRATVFTGFPWLILAASQWQRPLVLQVAAVTGSWGISFMLILFNLGLVFYLRTFLETRGAAWWKRICPEFYLALVCLLGVIGSGLLDKRIGAPQPAFSAGFVQPGVLPRARWDLEQMESVLADYRMVAQFAAYDGADAILWPEASTPLPAPGNEYAVQWLESLAAELGLPILMGNLVSVPDVEGVLRYYNGVIIVDPEDGIQEAFYGKRHLVPFGEYVPAWIPFVDMVVPLDGQFTRGDAPNVLDFKVGDRVWRVGALVCYEDLFPELARSQLHEGVHFFFVATNNIWYGREGAAAQHAAHSVLRAVELRRPVLRAGNEGWSGWIDERGNIRHVLRGSDGSIYFQGADAETFYLDPRYQGTLSAYARYGDWFVWLSMLVTAIAGASIRFWRPERAVPDV